MDNIIFEKVWIDDNPMEDFFQIKISASNNRICMSSVVYAQISHLQEISDGIKDLLFQPFEVVLGNDDDSFIDCVILRFESNKRGEISIHIYMKSMADLISNDTANFVIKTEIASLDEFSKNLNKISCGDVGEKIELNDSI